MTCRVLVVDDEAPVRFTVGEVLRDAGFEVIEAESVQTALGRLTGVDVVVSDLVMPGRNGLELLAEVKRRAHETPVIILTARGDERTAVAAMKDGAWDYLTKPFDNDELALCVQRADEHSRLLRSERRRHAQNDLPGLVVGESAVFMRLLGSAQRVAERDVTVLIRGETGTGKEALAGLVHAHSRRKKSPLIRFNCGAITESLAQAELFGFEKGSFTGAERRHEGYFRRAHQGTLVLDEVSELPASIQSSLLRALQQGEVQALGSKRVETVDVRVIACTNVPLLDRVRSGRFREDLYYRLNVVELEVPPLRVRLDDIPLLARHFQLKYAERFGLSDVPLPPTVMERFCKHDWPGNVRELENAVAKLLALSEDGVVDPQHLQLPLPSERRVAPGGSLRDQVADFERRAIEAALDAAGGNQSEAARRLETTRTTLIDKMKRLGISTGRDPEGA